MTATNPDSLRRKALALPIAIALGHALLFLGYLVDDAYISFRYARNLAGGMGLVYNSGERVEGYTNFLWVLWLSLGECLGIDATLLAPPLGLVCFVGLLLTTVRVARELTPDSPWAGMCGAGLLALFCGAGFYSVTGLETIAFAWLATLSLSASLRARPRALTAWTLLAVLMRPEGMLVAVLCFGWMLVRHRNRIRAVTLGVACAVFTLGVGTYAVFKVSYFGALLPNTFHAKTPDVVMGLRYVATGWPLLGLSGLALWRGCAETRAVTLGFLFCMAAIAWEGGDWMPAQRMFVHYLPWLMIAADAALLRTALPSARATVGLRVLAAACVLLYLVPQAAASARWRTKSLATGAMDEARADVFRRLGARGIDVVAAYDIGLLGEVLPHVTVIDLGGLVDRDIAHAPGGFSDKRPTLDYLERRRPQAVLIATQPPSPSAPEQRMPLFEVERYLVASAWLRTHYAFEHTYVLGDSYALNVFSRK